MPVSSVPEFGVRLNRLWWLRLPESIILIAPSSCRILFKAGWTLPLSAPYLVPPARDFGR